MQKDYHVLLSDRMWPSVKSKFTRGIRNPEKKAQLAAVLENTRKALVSDTQMQSITYLPKLVLPLVRRVFPRLIANNIISTQTLQSANGLIRYLDAYVRDARTGQRVENGSLFGQGNIYPWSSNETNYSLAPRKVFDGFKNASGVTTVKQIAEPVKDVNVSTDATTVSANASGSSYSGPLSKPFSEGTLYLIADLVENGKYKGEPQPVATITRNGVIQQLNQGVDTVYGQIDIKANTFVMFIKPAVVEVPSGGTAPTYVFYWAYKEDIQKNIVFGDGKASTSGDINDGNRNQTVDTMEFEIKSKTVNTKSRKLAARYSFELEEDYNNEFGEKFEDKMVDYMTTTILTEIDKEVISMLSSHCVWESSWDARQPVVWSRGQNAWYETVFPFLNGLSNTIFDRTNVAGASFLVCNPVTATIFQGLNQYEAKGNPTEGDMQVGAGSIGTINGGYDVYVSPMCAKNEIIMGFKGKSPEQTGAIYAPYVPITLHPITYNEGMNAILARSRYWMGVLRPDYYAKLTVTGLFANDTIKMNQALMSEALPY